MAPTLGEWLVHCFISVVSVLKFAHQGPVKWNISTYRKKQLFVTSASYILNSFLSKLLIICCFRCLLFCFHSQRACHKILPITVCDLFLSFKNSSKEPYRWRATDQWSVCKLHKVCKTSAEPQRQNRSYIWIWACPVGKCGKCGSLKQWDDQWDLVQTERMVSYDINWSHDLPNLFTLEE